MAQPLFVHQSIEIHAHPQRVWDVLIQPEYTNQWTGEFNMYGGISSDWQLGSPVEWRTKEGKVQVKGKVTAFELFRKLRFTVEDVDMVWEGERTAEDGITYELEENENKTLLTVSQGDFGVKPEYHQYYLATEKTWSIVLPKIKALAEER